MQNLDPVAAYNFLHANPEALLVDCRTEVEYMCVGHPKGAEHIAWQESPDWEIDPHFADKVRHLLVGDMSRPVLL
ncbi:MAG TPA: rhodanese-like domain-containing protein, partial [Azonexus sp.]|nr:rhodanese-like domain-containing protein [Azonexus sp.]